MIQAKQFFESLLSATSGCRFFFLAAIALPLPVGLAIYAGNPLVYSLVASYLILTAALIGDIFFRRRNAEPTLSPEEILNYRRIFEILPAAVYTTDAEGKLTFYNEAAAELWGRRPILGKDEWCGSWRIYTPDGQRVPLDQCPMAVALKENRSVRGIQAVVERPDGVKIPFLPYPTPIRDTSGRMIGAVNMLVRC